MDTLKSSFFRTLPSFLTIILVLMGFGLMYPLMTDIFINFREGILPIDTPRDLRHFYLGLGFVLYPLTMFLTLPFIGDISDHFGRKKILICCLTLFVISYIVMAIGVSSKSISLLLTGRALSGIAASSQGIAYAAIIDVSCQETKQMNLGKLTLIASIGLVIGPLIGGIFSDRNLSTHFTLSTPLYTTALISLITLIWTIFAFCETLPRSPKKPKLERTIHIFVEFLKDKRIKSLAMVQFLFQLGFGIYYQMISILLKQLKHYTNSQLGFFYAYLGIGFLIGILVIEKYIAHKFRATSIIICFMIIMGISQLLSSFSHLISMLYIFGFIIAVSNNVLFNELITLFSDSTRQEKQGWAMGIFAAINSLGFIFVGFSTNLLSIVSLKLVFVIGAVVSLISAIFLSKVSRKINYPIAR